MRNLESTIRSDFITIVLKKFFFLIVIMALCLFSCTFISWSSESTFNSPKITLDKKLESYSFFIGGHLYGAPCNDRSVFPSPSIIAACDTINESDAIFFISLGDNFKRITPVSVSVFKKNFASKIDIPIFNAVGSHDVSNRALYEENFGKTYFDFIYNNGLFIFLDTELTRGNISGEQLRYFENLLISYEKDRSIKNIFILTHRLLWSAHNPDYQVVFDNLNTQVGYPGDNNNFKNDIEPLLIKVASSNKSVYWFSGDIGTALSYSLFCGKDPQHDITYVATGVGNTENDAIIKVNVDKNGRVTFLPISLTGQILEPMERYDIDYWLEYFGTKKSPGITKKILRMAKHVYFLRGIICGLFLFGVIFLIASIFRRKVHNRIKIEKRNKYRNNI